MNISENNQPKKINLDISILNKNINGQPSKVIYYNDDEKPKIRLFNAYINLKDNQNRNVNLYRFEEENDILSNILNIIDINLFNFNQFFYKYLNYLKLNEEDKKESKKKLDEEEEKEKKKKDEKNDDKEENKKESKKKLDEEEEKEKQKKYVKNDDKEENKNQKNKESDDEEKKRLKKM